jgi:hypothetical protein
MTLHGLKHSKNMSKHVLKHGETCQISELKTHVEI